MTRRSGGKADFKKACKCIMHDIWSTGSDELSFKIDASRKFKSSVLRALRDEKLLNERANYLCYSCYSEFMRRRDLNSSQEPDVTLENEETTEAEVGTEENLVSTLLNQIIQLLKKSDLAKDKFKSIPNQFI